MSLTVIKFEASWCAPCRALAPILKKVASSMSDVTFETIDIDNHPALAQQMKISAVPTVVFVKDGQVVDTLVGLHREQVILDTINKWK